MAGSGPSAEVRISLQVEEAKAHAAIARTSAMFGKIAQSAQRALHGAMEAVSGFASTMFKAAGIAGLVGGLAGGFGLVEGAMEAARAAESQKKAIAQTLAITDQSGASFAQLKVKAAGLREEFVEMGMKAGVMGSEVASIFQEIAERSGRPTSAVKELTEKIVQAGRVVGDTETITRGMRMLEMGMTGARNPIVALIRSTGVLKGSIHDVSHALSKMKPEDQLRAGEEAINKLAAKAKDLPLTFGQMANQLKQMKENVLENIGGPLISGIMPALMEVQKWIAGHRREIEAYAKALGQKVGEWVKAAAKMMGEAFKWIDTHSKEISDAIQGAASALKSVFSFIIAHKEVIAGMFAAKALGGLVGMGGKAGAAAAGIGIYKEILEGVKDAVDKAFVHKETKHEAAGANMNAGMDAIQQMYKAKNLQGLLDYQKQFVEYAEQWDGEKGKKAATKFIDKYINALWDEQSRQSDRMHDLAMKADDGRRTIQDTLIEIGKAKDSYGKNFMGPTPDFEGQSNEQGAYIAKIYNDAITAQDQGMQMQAAILLRSSDMARQALINSGVEISEGIDKLAAMVGGSAGEALKKLFTDRQASLNKPTMTQNFSGGQTFHITQDFRKADPDNVAIVTRKDTFKRAFARGFAKTAIFQGS